jgi:hypothetical protein
MSLMKRHPCVDIYTSPHPHCRSSYILFILIQLLLNIFTTLNGLLRIVLFILDVYIVNQVGSPQCFPIVIAQIVGWAKPDPIHKCETTMGLVIAQFVARSQARG